MSLDRKPIPLFISKELNYLLMDPVNREVTLPPRTTKPALERLFSILVFGTALSWIETIKFYLFLSMQARLILFITYD